MQSRNLQSVLLTNTNFGVAITGTIKCDVFAPHVAEGGR